MSSKFDSEYNRLNLIELNRVELNFDESNLMSLNLIVNTIGLKAIELNSRY